MFLSVCQSLSAADSALIKYSLFPEAVSVSESKQLSETGELAPALAAQLKRAKQKPEEFRKSLNRRGAVDAVFLSKFLNSFFGESLLDYATEIVHTPNRTASRQALRGALVTSAINDNEIQIIEVLANYPTSEVHVDGNRLLDLINQIESVLKKMPRLPF
ncbi:MAG: alpha/beta hydrolase [Microcystis sp.]